MHPWVLPRVDRLRRAFGEHLLEAVAPSVLRGEDEDVRDVVQEPRTAAFVPAVDIAHGAREEMEAPVVEDGARVEDRAVARHGAVGDDRAVPDPMDSGSRRCLLGLTGHRGVRA